MTAVTVANISFPFIEEDRHVKFLPHEALSLTAALEAAGHRVDLRDYQLVAENYEDPQDPVNAGAFFAGANPAVFIITPHDAMPVAILWAEHLKNLEPGHTVILGGYGPRHAASAIIKGLPFIDGVIHGTLEVVGPLLMNHPEGDWHQVPGVAFRNGSKVYVNPPPAQLTTLDELPLPAYHQVDLNSYWEINLFSARGCPFGCSFCVRGGKVVEKSIDGIIEEISLLRHRYHQKRFFFYDQTFTLKKKRVIELCQRFRAESLDEMEWSCTGRLNIADLELMKEMADSGCNMIYFGVESGSDRVLQRIRKGITREMAQLVIKEAQRFFYVNAFFIWGFPFEDREDFQATLDLVRRLSDQGVTPIIYVLSMLPSSGLHREYHQQLEFCREVWEANWPVHLDNPGSRDQIARLIEAYPEVFPGFYCCDPQILAKLRAVKDLKLETHFPDV
jgi:anaerobic magnesium-protoporphyrin IX monomethyl ester cyclase